MKKLTTLLCFAGMLLFSASCDLTLLEDEPTPSNNTGNGNGNGNGSGTGSGTGEGKIYLRLTQNTAGGGSTSNCDPAGHYYDNNSAVPGNAAMNTWYGPCAPGDYDGSYYFDKNESTSEIEFEYHLSAPAAGMKRYYTLSLKQYSSSVNRCLTGVSGGPTYYDQPE